MEGKTLGGSAKNSKGWEGEKGVIVKQLEEGVVK